MTAEQKAIADRVVKVFCLSVMWMGIGIMTFPVYLPLMARDFSLNGTKIGIILCIPALMQIVSVPLIGKITPLIGIEMTILSSGLLYGIAFCGFAGATYLKDPDTFFYISIGVNVITPLL
jgi:MFS family permease